MKKLSLLLVLFLVFASFGLAVKTTDNGCSGSTWTTDANGGTQNKNHYNIGEGVYLNAENLPANELTSWKITNLPHTEVASGSIMTSSNGAINAALLYTPVAGDANSEFKVTLEYEKCAKHDNFRVNNYEVPEFGTIAALVALLGSAGIFMVIRRKH